MTTLVAICIAFYIWSIEYPEIANYEDSAQWPISVGETAAHLATLRGNVSVDDFGEGLYRRGLTESSGWEHYKDFEHYWTIEQNGQMPRYVVAGTFFPTSKGSSRNQFVLKYATINIVEKPGGRWRTTCSIIYPNTGFELLTKLKIRKPSGYNER